MSALFTRADQSVFGQWWWTVDRRLLAAFTALFICGMILVAAASPPVAERINLPQSHFIIRHLVFLFPAFILMVGVSFLSPRNVWRAASLVFTGSVLGVLLALLTGEEIKGAQRWLNMFGFSVQPSEFMKVSFAVVAAWFMARQKEDPGFPGNRIVIGLFAFAALLLLLQPDVGMTFILASIYGGLIFLAGLPLSLVLVLIVLAAASLPAAYFLFDHVRSRFDRFFDPASGDSYQIDKAMEAFRSGGAFGTGPGQGTVKLQLPDAHSDFIFAVAGEEMGLLFVGILIMLFAFVMLRGFNRLMDCDDIFIVLATGGLLTMFGMQALVHMASSVHLIPTKGMTLPFISYGGSSLMAMALAMGFVLALTRHQGKKSVARGSAVKKRRIKKSTA